MSKKREYRERGPGQTFHYVNGDGDVSRCRHNDSGWCTPLATEDELTPNNVAKLLDIAYDSGFEDGREYIRRAIGVSK